jgi:hypothetical protein
VEAGAFVASVAAVGERFVAAQDVPGACQGLSSTDAAAWAVLDTDAWRDARRAPVDSH